MTILKSIRTYSFLIFIAVNMISCDINNDGNNLIDGPAGEAEFMISNQLNRDIIAIYRLPSNSEVEFIDTTQTISNNNSIKFFETAAFGSNPTPADSFMQIEFYEASNMTNPILSLSPLQNNDWEIIEQELADSGYGLTVYEYVLRNENLE